VSEPLIAKPFFIEIGCFSNDVHRLRPGTNFHYRGRVFERDGDHLYNPVRIAFHFGERIEDLGTEHWDIEMLRLDQPDVDETDLWNGDQAFRIGDVESELFWIQRADNPRMNWTYLLIDVDFAKIFEDEHKFKELLSANANTIEEMKEVIQENIRIRFR